MFTGIITDIGTIQKLEPLPAALRITIATRFDMDKIRIGDSIACSGACLTVVAKEANAFAVEVSAETLRCTILGSWKLGSKINLEQSLKMGDSLDGHLVSGHVDTIATLKSKQPEQGSVQMNFEIKQEFSRFIAPKGSITIDGVSLTINRVEDCHFSVNIIPHTLTATTLGSLEVGGQVNIEIDLIARYVARLLGK